MGCLSGMFSNCLGRTRSHASLHDLVEPLLPGERNSRLQSRFAHTVGDKQLKEVIHKLVDWRSCFWRTSKEVKRLLSRTGQELDALCRKGDELLLWHPDPGKEPTKIRWVERSRLSRLFGDKFEIDLGRPVDPSKKKVMWRSRNEAMLHILLTEYSSRQGQEPSLPGQAHRSRQSRSQLTIPAMEVSVSQTRNSKSQFEPRRREETYPQQEEPMPVMVPSSPAARSSMSSRQHEPLTRQVTHRQQEEQALFTVPLSPVSRTRISDRQSAPPSQPASSPQPRQYHEPYENNHGWSFGLNAMDLGAIDKSLGLTLGTSAPAEYERIAISGNNNNCWARVSMASIVLEYAKLEGGDRLLIDRIKEILDTKPLTCYFNAINKASVEADLQSVLNMVQAVAASGGSSAKNVGAILIREGHNRGRLMDPGEPDRAEAITQGEGAVLRIFEALLEDEASSASPMAAPLAGRMQDEDVLMRLHKLLRADCAVYNRLPDQTSARPGSGSQSSALILFSAGEHGLDDFLKIARRGLRTMREKPDLILGPPPDASWKLLSKTVYRSQSAKTATTRFLYQNTHDKIY